MSLTVPTRNTTSLVQEPNFLGKFLLKAQNSVVRKPQAQLALPEKKAPTIACIIPAYNEEKSISDVLNSLLAQTRLPDVIHVIVNNTTDDTVKVASRFQGSHKIKTAKGTFYTTVQIHDIGKNADKKVGALNHGWNLTSNYDYIFGVDGDTMPYPECLEQLEEEIVSDSRIGGLSAIYSIDTNAYGSLSKFLVLGQRAQFAGFNMDNLMRGRNMAVIGGQCSLFSSRALKKVMNEYNQDSPWVRDSEVEDSLLSLQIKKVGFSTKISARARAVVGAMDSVRALHGQQVKWNYGSIDLMFPGQRDGVQGQPFHPNLRLRWREQFSMLINIFTRLAFFLLLTASLSIGAFVFNPIWLIPPAIAVALNVRIASSLHDKKISDYLYALLAFPAEIYLWLRIVHFSTAWTRFFSKVQKDNWAAQAAAERGSGGNGLLFPIIFVAVLFTACAFAWTQQSLTIQSAILGLGWPLLYIVTICQTLFMAKKLFRRQRGYTV